MPSSGGQKCARSEEHTSELQSHDNLVCRLLLEKKHSDPGAPPPPRPLSPAASALPASLRRGGAGGSCGRMPLAGWWPVCAEEFCFFFDEWGNPGNPPPAPPARSPN